MKFNQSYLENKEEFIKRLIEAGWKKNEAELEWKRIREDEESGE